MSQLHVFSSLPSFQRGQVVLSQLSPDDAVLLRADALYQLLRSEDFGAGSHAIEADALARGLDPKQFPHINWIDYDGWVALVIAHSVSVSW